MDQDDGTSVLDTRFAYDAAGNVTAVTDPKDQETAYAYDALSRLESVTQELSQAVAYDYDARGRLDTVTNARSQVLDYDYAPWGGLLGVEHVGASPARTVSYTYDDAGNLLTTTDSQLEADPLYPSGPLYTFTYDAADRVDTVTAHYLPGGDRTLDADYDAYGNRDRLVFTDGADSFDLRWTYDALDRLDQAELPLGEIVDFDYLANGALPTDELQRITHPNGATTDYTFWDEGPVRNILVRDSGLSQLLQLDYTVDALLNVDLLTEEHDGAQSYSYDYDYDGFNRLSRAQLPAALGLPADTPFAYDDAGNRDDDPAEASPWRYDANNRIEASPGSPADVAYTFDADGNVDTKIDNGTTETFTFDFTNRLRAWGDGTTTAAYDYDPFGRRLKKTVSGVTTWYLWDGDQLLAELDGSGDRQVRYAYAGGFAPLRVAEDDGAGGEDRYEVHTDHLDTPRMLTDGSEASVWRAAYQGYGQAALDAGNSVTFNIRFPGQYHDGETGLYYNRFRYYGPELGRYITADPIGQSDNINVYAYVDAPTKSFDALGLGDVVNFPKDKARPPGRGIPRGPATVTDISKGNRIGFMDPKKIVRGASRIVLTIGAAAAAGYASYCAAARGFCSFGQSALSPGECMQTFDPGGACCSIPGGGSECEEPPPAPSCNESNEDSGDEPLP